MHPLIPSCERPDLPLTIAASRDLSKLPVGPMNTGWIDFCKRRVQQEDFNPFAPGDPYTMPARSEMELIRRFAEVREAAGDPPLRKHLPRHIVKRILAASSARRRKPHPCCW